MTMQLGEKRIFQWMRCLAFHAGKMQERVIEKAYMRICFLEQENVYEFVNNTNKPVVKSDNVSHLIALILYSNIQPF